MSNYVLMYIENRADLLRPWTEVLNSQAASNRTSWPFQISSNGRSKDTETSTIDIAKTCKK